MSAADILLLFLRHDGGVRGWLRLTDGAVAARGGGLEGLPLADAASAPLRTAAIVPGDQVAVHWLELPPGLAPAQASAAGRLMAEELGAAPSAETHVAVGSELEGSLFRCVGLVSATAMATWIATCRAAGADPDIILPEPLLILPEDGRIIRHDGPDRPLFRGPADACAIEPELAGLIFADAPIETIDTAGFEAGLAEAIDRRPLDLRQGAFAKRRRWGIDWKLVRRLSLLAAAILCMTLILQMATIVRYTFAADEVEAEANRIAATALPDGARASDPRGQLARRVADLRVGAGYSGIVPGVFAAIQSTPNAQLAAFAFDGAGLRVSVTADSPATLDAVVARIRAAGLAATATPLRNADGRQLADITVRVP